MPASSLWRTSGPHSRISANVDHLVGAANHGPWVVSGVSETSRRKPRICTKAGDVRSRPPRMFVLEVTTDDRNVMDSCGRRSRTWRITLGGSSRRTWWPSECRPTSATVLPGVPLCLLSHNSADVTPLATCWSHHCINFRHHDKSIYKWELDKGDEGPFCPIAVTCKIVLDD